MDRAYANALKKKDELERELAKVNAFLAMYHEFSGSEREQTEPAGKESLPVDSSGNMTHRPRRRLRPSEIADLSERVIRGADGPLTRAEIVSRLENAGVEIHSEDKPRYVGTILWRQKNRFVNIDGKGYVMADMVRPSGSGKTPAEEQASNEKTEDSPGFKNLIG